jgi:hypothetical protein
MRNTTPAHFPLKYWFSASGNGERGQIFEAFAAGHAPSPVRIEGLGHFARDDLFMDEKGSAARRRPKAAGEACLPYVEPAVEDAVPPQMGPSRRSSRLSERTG